MHRKLDLSSQSHRLVLQKRLWIPSLRAFQENVEGAEQKKIELQSNLVHFAKLRIPPHSRSLLIKSLTTLDTIDLLVAHMSGASWVLETSFVTTLRLIMSLVMLDKEGFSLGVDPVLTREVAYTFKQYPHISARIARLRYISRESRVPASQKLLTRHFYLKQMP